MSEIIQQGGASPGIGARAKAIIVAPREEWPKIAGESDSVQAVFTRYVVPLAAIGPVCGFIGGQLFGIGAFGFSYHPSLIGGLSSAIIGYVMALLSIFLVGWVASFLADKFGGKESFPRAFRLCAYSFTAAYLAGVFQLLPSLSILVLLASLYGIYLFYLGATPMMAVPQDKAVGYTAVTIIAVIMIYVAVAAVTSAVTGVFGLAATVGARDAENGVAEVSVPGYGKVKVENNGDNQTVEVPGYGTVHVTRNGDTVKIESPNGTAEVKDANAGK